MLWRQRRKNLKRCRPVPTSPKGKSAFPIIKPKRCCRAAAFPGLVLPPEQPERYNLKVSCLVQRIFLLPSLLESVCGSLPEFEFLSVSPSFKVYLWLSSTEVVFCKRKYNHSVLQLFLLQYCNTLHKGTCRISSDILHSQHLLSTDHFTQNPQGKPSPFSVSTCFRIWSMCRLPALTMMPISFIAARFFKTFKR